MADHWFDLLNKSLIRGTPRRTMLGVVPGLVVWFTLHADPNVEAAKNRKKRKKKRKGKDKPQNSTCSKGACVESFSSQADRTYCEFICQQCDGNDPRDFCIVDTDQTKVAFCCPADRECCGDICCGPEPIAPGRRCCDQQCVNTLTNPNHCGSCGNACSPGKECRDGVCDCLFDLTRCGAQCLNTNVDEFNCGGCGVLCSGPGSRCCDGDCVDTRSNLDHCGACGLSCAGVDGRCCDGDCVITTRDEFNCGGCGLTCLGEGMSCCSNECVDTRTDPNNCGRCGRQALGFLCCGGHLFDPALQFCCPDGLRPCFNSQVCCTLDDGRPACCTP